MFMNFCDFHVTIFKEMVNDIFGHFWSFWQVPELFNGQLSVRQFRLPVKASLLQGLGGYGDLLAILVNSDDVTRQSAGGGEHPEDLLPMQMFFFFLVLGLPGHHGEKFRELDVATGILVEFVDNGLEKSSAFFEVNLHNCYA